MINPQKLSELINEIDATMRVAFAGRTFWIKAEITDVKKQPDKRWCFLKFIEKSGSIITTEMKAVFWATTYNAIENFETNTQQTFASGLEITCCVRVRFHKRYGLDLEVLEIDYAYAIGKLELERKQTLERLVRENPSIQQLSNGNYSTINNRIQLPLVIQNIALITAPNSDGQRDFYTVIEKNKYGYAFSIVPFLTTIQGDNASRLILQQLQIIQSSKKQFDVIAIVRGGGSDIDFKSFNDYDLAQAIALCNVPILTGIGHDRNTSIADLMARQHKTPTEVATYILDINLDFENSIMQLRDRFFVAIDDVIESAKNNLAHYKQRIKNLSPQTILNKGFAMVMHNNKIITNPEDIELNTEIKTILKNQIIHSTVTKKHKHEK